MIIKNNYIYFFWALFYLIIFFPLIPVYIITFILALSPLGEGIWRTVKGIRPLRIRKEKERLLPLFKEVYVDALQKYPELSRNIHLFVTEEMNINAFALGKKTLVLTKGSILLLNDECLKGFIAHELGHFARHDPSVALFMIIFNLPMSLIIKYLTDVKETLNKNKKSLIGGMFSTLADAVYYPFKIIEFLSDLIVNHTKRESEYEADLFALKIGYGEELNEVLNELYEKSYTEPGKVKEQLKRDHPHFTKRIEILEKFLSGNNETEKTIFNKMPSNPKSERRIKNPAEPTGNQSNEIKRRQPIPRNQSILSRAISKGELKDEPKRNVAEQYEEYKIANEYETDYE